MESKQSGNKPNPNRPRTAEEILKKGAETSKPPVTSEHALRAALPTKPEQKETANADTPAEVPSLPIDSTDIKVKELIERGPEAIVEEITKTVKQAGKSYMQKLQDGEPLSDFQQKNLQEIAYCVQAVTIATLVFRSHNQLTPGYSTADIKTMISKLELAGFVSVFPSVRENIAHYMQQA